MTSPGKWGTEKLNPDMTPTRTRTDACLYCGEIDCIPYYRPHGQECRSALCEMTERAKKAEAQSHGLARRVVEAETMLEVVTKQLKNYTAAIETL